MQRPPCISATHTTISTIVLSLLISLNSIAKEGDSTSLTISIQKSTGRPTASIEFERTDNDIKWFRDSESSESGLMYELNVSLSNQINIHYRKHSMQGIHTGKALKKVCIFISCFWANDSLFTGLERNEEIHYQIDNNELWVGRSFFNNTLSLTVSPFVGVNILPALFTIKGAGEHESRRGILPIPFWGFNLSKKLSDNVKITSEIHHFKYNTPAWGLLYYVYQVGIEKRLSRNFGLSIGYTKRRLHAKYNKNSTDAEFNLDAHSPFITISTRF